MHSAAMYCKFLTGFHVHVLHAAKDSERLVWAENSVDVLDN